MIVIHPSPKSKKADLMQETELVVWLDSCRIQDVDKVGGKNASLGEMLSQLQPLGLKIPQGFATTAHAFRTFLSHNGLDHQIQALLKTLDADDTQALMETGQQIRQWILNTPLPKALQTEVRTYYQKLTQDNPHLSVAVRSSATAEDLPDASFAGQQETYLNVHGIDAVLDKIKHVFASLFNDRAISYRVHQGYSHHAVALSVGIQQMVRSDLAASGVMFSLDTESGFDKVVFITSSYGLGELVVQGAVNPDEFYVYKPNLATFKPAILRKTLGLKQQYMLYADNEHALVNTLPTPFEKVHQFSITDEEAHTLARQALLIEQHYGRPMDIEWAKNGPDGDLYIVQARPETVQSRQDGQTLEQYALISHQAHKLSQGRSVGQRIGQGPVKIILSAKDMYQIQSGDVLVTDMTDPDWEPVMKKASAIVTNRGGRTCHAAIIARELGIPAVVGCVNATDTLKNGQTVTVSCAEGDIGFIYEGLVPFTVKTVPLQNMPSLPFKMMMNVGNPDRAFHFQAIPNEGVGLARLEFIISQMIGIHPMACLQCDTLNPILQKEIRDKTAAYGDPITYYVERLKEGIATIAASFFPKPVIIRFSDFKSNEYANLIGGTVFEPHEENPMIGFRGAARYVSPTFQAAFELECRAVKKVREDMGLTNVAVMVPFVRSVKEAEAVVALLAQYGLKRGEKGLKIMMMCELPTNALLAEAYLEHFDGFSIGSNDMTQLTLGLDRDSALVAAQFDERDAAVKQLLAMAIRACQNQGKYIGICGQGPSDHPDLARWLMEQGIDSVSLNPDTVLATWLYLAGPI